MKTTKRRFVCVLSVAALSATMLTVPVYSEEPPAADGDTIRVEGESYDSDSQGTWTLHTPGDPQINKAVSEDRLNLTQGDFSEDDKPYVSFTFDADRAGIYDLEYVANYITDAGDNNIWLSPFSVTVNDGEKIRFSGATPLNDNMTSYRMYTENKEDNNYYFGKYNVPVYLEAGSNTITFTIEGKIEGNKNASKYTFYLDYFQFTYNDTATKSETIQVEAEELIAGNVPNVAAQIVEIAHNAASNGKYYQFNNTTNEGGYLEYIVPASEAGEYQLTLAGSNTDYTTGLKGWVGDYTIVVNDDEDSKISVGSEDGQSSDVKTETHFADTLDTIVSNKNVTLKQGLNKVKVLLDRAATNKNHVIHLDYLQFTPASEIISTQEPEDDGTIRVEGENYNTTDTGKWTFNTPTDGQVGTSDKLGTPSHTGMVLNNGTYSDDNKPSATYTFNVGKAGIYDLEYVANYLKDEAKDRMYLSPFSVTLNDVKILFDGDTPNNPEMISYSVTNGDLFGTYKLPVYLVEGENKITFTVEGKRYKGGNGTQYEFYLDYFRFTYNDTATTSDMIQVEAEDLIAGNVPSASGIAKMTADSADPAVKAAAGLASNQTMYQFITSDADGYLEYIVPSAKDGDFKLEITGSNTDKTTGLKSWCGDFNVTVNDTEISVGEDVTSEHQADVYDVMTANKTVSLKKGLNKIRVDLDEADSRGRYVIHLDYLKFTPASEIIPTQEPDDNGIIKVEGENYNTTDKGKWTFNTPTDGQVGTSDKLGDPARTGMVLNSKSGGTYDDSNKPSATYTFSVKKAGIYDLEYVANYLKDEAKDYMYLSPFSVTLNDVQILFDGDTPNNPEMIYYNAPTKGAALFGTYKLPVYLEAGENKITFTVEGKRYKGGNGYEFYLDYFELTYDEEATVSDTIQVEAEDLIAGNVPSSNGIAKMTVESKDTALKAAAELASNQTMYQFITSDAGGYLEYIVPSAKDGDFNLEITGSNTDKTTGLKSWCGDFNVTVNDTEISVGEDVTSEHKADVYDVMTANKTVSLKKGLNKIRVDLDRPAGDGRYVIHLDYLKFTPASEIIPTPAPVEKIEVSDFTVDSFGVASASITNDGDAPVTVAVISVSYNADKTLASVKLTQKTIGSNVTETVKTDALANATSDTRAYVWNMNGNKPLNEAITSAAE